MGKTLSMSKDIYEHLCSLPGPPPVGYIEGVGYADYYTMPTAEAPVSAAYARKTDYFGTIMYIPYLITDDKIMDTLMSQHFLKKNVVSQNPDGSCYVNTFDGKVQTVPNCRGIKVYIDTEESYGLEQKILVVEITSGSAINSRTLTFKIEVAAIIPQLPDWFDLQQNMLTYASFTVGATSFHTGRYFEKKYNPTRNKLGYGYNNHDVDQVMKNTKKNAFFGKKSMHSMRPIRNGWGYAYDGATFDNVLDNTKGRGYGRMTHLSPYFKWGGLGLGVIGVGISAWDLYEGKISIGKGTADIFFGIVGFCGWPGLIISTYYFLTISPYIDDVITVERHDSTALVLAADNTRVSLPPRLDPVFIPEQKPERYEERPIIIQELPGNL